jgi:P-type Cu2+ transporter
LADRARLQQAVRAVGYEPLPDEASRLRDVRKLAARARMWRWLVAALCMMQVMMYAYPSYVAEAGSITDDQAQLLRLVSWALTLPVVLFSCTPIWRQAWLDLRGRRLGMDTPVALGLWITFMVSTAATFQPGGVFGTAVYFDSLTMFVFFLLSARWVEGYLRERTAGALEALARQLPRWVRRVRRAGEAQDLIEAEQVLIEDVRLGDVLSVLPGDVFGADGVVLFGHTTVDEALLTGESRPVTRQMGQAVVAGSGNLSGAVQVEVKGLGAQTRYAQIAALMDSAAQTKPRVMATADRLATPFLLIVLALAAATGAWHWSDGQDKALMLAVTVLIVTCPCALSLAAPAALIASAGRMARGGVLVQHLDAIERLATIDTVVFDKTGTLTLDRLEVVHWVAQRRVGHAHAMAWARALASHSLHPAAQAIARIPVAAGDPDLLQLHDVQENAGAGLSAQCILHGRSLQLRLGSAEFCGVSASALEIHEPARWVYLSDSQGMLARFELAERLRPGAAQTVARLQALGLRVQLQSGDSSQAVQHVAADLGLLGSVGGTTPSGKLDAVRQLADAGHRVAMVGDGLNDGPALAGASVSLAMGHAVDLAKTRSDFILQSDALPAVADLVVTARKTLRVMRQNLFWAFAYNLVCVPLAAMGVFSPWVAGLGMAASSLLVVGNAARLASPSRGLDLSQTPIAEQR